MLKDRTNAISTRCGAAEEAQNLMSIDVCTKEEKKKIAELQKKLAEEKAKGKDEPAAKSIAATS